MEIPFYHDDVLIALAASSSAAAALSPSAARPGGAFPDGSSMMKKDGLSLALGPGAAGKSHGGPGPHPQQQQPPSGGPDGAALLSSPDLGLLKLASPELERLIIQSNGLVTTTPTSGGAQFHFPKGGAPDEQEFAAGFHGPPEPPIYANLSPFAGAAGGYPADGSPFSRLPPPPPPAPLKDEPQTVPEVASFGDSPPLSPIDMDTQERIKAERKRLRNRIAASKCRRRKLERISRLEEKVKSLKSQNTELASTANLLREQVAQLKQKVLSHVNSGCQLLPQAAAQPPHQVPAY
uniref:Transcription factor JunD n=1 Tax=Podarcis muralis TaxID=64176 RepID=A0A670KL79_PODMU